MATAVKVPAQQPLALKFKPEDLLLPFSSLSVTNEPVDDTTALYTSNLKTIHFTISDMNVSLANAIRRTVLADIPTVVFADANMVITTNTTRMNNELIKQRLRCIPIYGLTESDNLGDYEMSVNLENNTNETIYVTTENFRVYDKRTKKFIENRRIFPPTIVGGEECFIDLVRLRRKLPDRPAEQLTLTCQFSIGTANQDSAYNVVNKMSYGLSVDDDKAEAYWRDVKLPALLAKNPDLDAAFAKRDFDMLDRFRFYKPDAFNFVIASVGPYSAKAIIHKALSILMEKLEAFKALVQGTTEATAVSIVKPTKSTLAQGYDVLLKNGEGYTIGKIVEFELNSSFYQGSEELSYVGFRKPHPHIDECLIRLAFKDSNTTMSYVQTCLVKATDAAITKFADIIGEFAE